MKGLLSYKEFLLFIGFILMISCTKEIDPADVLLLDNTKEMIAFQFLAEENEALDIDITARIDEESKTIAVVLPYGTIITELTPALIISETASIVQEGEASLDFSEPVIYSVMAEDRSVSDYTVNVRVIANTQREILRAFFDQNPDNTLGWDIDNEDIATWDGVIIEDTTIVALEFIEKGITVFSPEICDLFYLESLVLEGNEITEIPAAIQNVSNYLTRINIAKNQITALPDQFYNLINLEDLTLYTNLLTEISPDINKLKKLKKVSISSNPLESLPVEFFELTQLNSLLMNNIGLSEVPLGMANLAALTSLRISSNPIGVIPDQIISLASLTRLDIDNANIGTIPPEINKLTKLKRLQLSRNDITEINMSISDLVMLEVLLLNDNTIEEVPVGLSDLINLTTLNFTENEIISIPTAVCDLANTGTEILMDDGVLCQ